MSKATKHMTSTCEKHKYNFLGLPECPHCVRDERDRLRRWLHQSNMDWADDNQFVQEATRKALPTEDVDGDSHFAPTVQDFTEMLCAEIAKVREERDRLRDLIPQAWEAAQKRMTPNRSFVGAPQATFREWMEQKGLL